MSNPTQRLEQSDRLSDSRVDEIADGELARFSSQEYRALAREVRELRQRLRDLTEPTTFRVTELTDDTMTLEPCAPPPAPARER